jgi:hypothetical protein
VGVGVYALYEGSQVLAAGEGGELLALVGADAFVQAAQAGCEGGGEVGGCSAYGYGLEELFRGYGRLAFEGLGLGLVAFEDADGVDEDEVGLGRGVGGDGVEGGLVYDARAAASLTTGLRMGEALALKWSDVDLAGGTLRVNRQLQRMRSHDDEGKPSMLVFSEPKNASRRTVDLPQSALTALKRHRKGQLEEKLGAGGSYEDPGLVFATVKGTPLDAQNVVNRHFKPLLRRAGLPDIRWHDLRHSCFTLLLSRVVHPKFVQHLAGHASIQLTLDRYSHWMPTMGKHTASAMDEILDEAGRADASAEGKDAL